MNTKQQIINEVETWIAKLGLNIVELDLNRPWGGFFRLENIDAEKFINSYFADIKDTFTTFEDLSPKFLIIEPGKRLSWQYHNRRGELWRVLEGPVGVKLSDNDTEPEHFTVLPTGNTVKFGALTRHRLMGLDDWGVVAEIWQHNDTANESNELDIIRVADDFGR